MSADPMIKMMEEDIGRVLLSASKLTEKGEPRNQFRCSSLPFCPLRNFLGLAKNEESFRKDFYVRAGTAIHETVQTWLPQAPQGHRLVGCWKCQKCGTFYDKPVARPDSCRGCGEKKLTYVEATVEYRGLSGHIDLIYEWFKQQHIVLDIKTTSLQHTKRKYPKTWRQYYPPTGQYTLQIKTYAALLRELYDLNIVGVALIFVDRARAIETKDDFHIVVGSWDNVKHEKLMRKINRACDHNDILLRLNKEIEKSTDFSHKAERLLRHMIHNRPCKSEITWNAWMKHGFFRKECSMLPYCLRGDQATMREVIRQLDQ